jgi:site-specific DNA recombinase
MVTKKSLKNLKIKIKILNDQYLEELVKLVNADLAVGYSLFKEKIANIDIKIQEVENRLLRLYDALETGKLTLDDLSPRIKELRAKQDELGKARIIAEAEMAVQGYQQLDIDMVRSYVMDLRKLLDESEVAQRKAFLRSFIKKIVVDKDIVKLYYKVPVPPDGKRMETMGVLPIDTPSGEGGTRTPMHCCTRS